MLVNDKHMYIHQHNVDGSWFTLTIKPLNADLIPICHLLALLGAHHILHVSKIRVNIKFALPVHLHVKMLE
jgi:hypothetical protein